VTGVPQIRITAQLLIEGTRPTKIRSFDPLLTTVLTAHPTQPLSPLFHPPVERAAS